MHTDFVQQQRILAILSYTKEYQYTHISYTLHFKTNPDELMHSKELYMLKIRNNPITNVRRHTRKLHPYTYNSDTYALIRKKAI